MRGKDASSYNADLEFYNDTYLSLLADSSYCIGGCIQTRGQDYYLSVINVVDSIAVTKLIKRKYPWVQIRNNDKVLVSTN